MKKSIALGITLAGIGATIFGALSLYKLTKEEQADIDMDINIGNDIDVDTDVDMEIGNKEENKPIDIKVLEPDVKEEEIINQWINPLSDEAMKTDKQWNPDEPIKVMTPEELDKLGNVNPLNNTKLF